MNEVEIKEKRGRKVKQYLHRDGTITAKVFCDDIHFVKNGVYEEIDNTLVKEKSYYVNKDNDYKVYFYKKTKDSLMKIEKDKHFLNIKLDNCNDVEIDINKNKSKLRSSLIYRNILNNIDFKYDVSPNKVKETIILNNKNSLLEKIIFILESDLELVLENKEILAKAKDNIIFKFEVPYMFDSDNFENTNVNYNFFKKSDKYILELILDTDWLKEERNYPVYIDPTITNFSDNGTVYDTYISSNAVNSNKGNEDILKCGVERINGVDVIHRTLLKFDLPEIGTSDEIIDASLFLVGYPTTLDQFYSKMVEIHRITEDWNESGENPATWSNMNDKYSARVEALYDFYRSTIENGQINMGAVALNGNITDLVKKWYSDTPNYGIMIKSPQEVYEDDNFPAFFSKNNTIQGDSPQPTLIISYRNQNGLENYLNYITQSFSNGRSYLNTFNGNLTSVWKLASTIGGKLPTNVDLIYNTNDVVLNKDTIYGKGYKLSLDQTITETEIDDYDCLEYLDEDGTIHYFYKESIYDEEGNLQDSNVYYDEDGLNLQIEKYEDKCVLLFTNGGKFIFIKNSNCFYLMEIEDCNSNKVLITRDSNNVITKVTDADNSEINFYYETNVIRVVGSSTTTYLNYNNGLLSSIQSVEGITNFTYNENNLITSITGVTGIRINYSYYENSPYRLYKVIQYGLDNVLGNEFTITYGFNVTNIVDHLGRVNTLIFNSNGSLISSNNLAYSEDINNAYSLSKNYGEDYESKNKLLYSSIPVRYVKNYLRNTSFEEDELYFDMSEFLDATMTNEYYVSGNKCLKAVSNDNGQSLTQTIEIPKGKYYTFSGYFKNNNPVKLRLSYLDVNQDNVEVIENIPIASDFVRREISIFYASDATSLLKLQFLFDNSTISYIDDIQLEDGEIANNYNMLENSDFSEGLNDWTLEAEVLQSDDDSELYPNDYFSVVQFNNNNNTALKVEMKPQNRTSFSKTLPICGHQGDLYHISFWYKNEGIYTDGHYSGNNVTMLFLPAEGVNADYCTFSSPEFLPNESIWQYFSCEFYAEHDYRAIELFFNQGRDANNFYITNLCVTKDFFSNYYNYDSKGNLISLSDTNDDSYSFNYDDSNHLISATDMKGKHYKFEYDNNNSNRVLSAISSMGIVNQVKYDSFGNPIYTRISKKSNSELVDGSYKIRCKGTEKYLMIENARNVCVGNNYCSNPVWVLNKIGDNFKIFLSDMTNYSLSYLIDDVYLTNLDSNNLFTLEANENGSYCIKKANEDKYLKVSNNNVVFSTLVADDFSFEFYFESLEDMFIENSSTYTSDGKFVSSVTDSNSNTTFYTKDQNTGLTVSMTNANNYTTNYEYDEKNKLISVTQGSKNVLFNYSNGLLTNVTQGNKIYKINHDNFIKTKSISLGDDIVLTTNNYFERNGELSSVVYGNGQSVNFTYDEFDRLKTNVRTDKTYEYKYDNNGNIARIVSNDVHVKYSYDMLKRLCEYKEGNFKINYSYDANDNVVIEKQILNDNMHILESDYNSDDLLLKCKIDNVNFNYCYDSLSRVVGKNIDNNSVVEYEYVTNGKKTSDLIKSISFGNEKYSYKYDNLENITQIYLNNQLIKEYSYDEWNELIQENDFIKNERINYIYDNSGNLLTKTSINISTNDIINVDTYSYENEKWEDQLTKFNNHNLSYDNIGNLLSIGNNISLSWINGKMLNTYTDITSNLNVSYKYNFDGVRSQKKINNLIVDYYLEGSNILYEKRGNDLIYYMYDTTGVVGLEYNNNKYFYVKNIFNDVIGIVDSSHNLIVKYEYDSWGKILSVKDGNGNLISDNSNVGIVNPFRYRSYYYDEETKLYYLNTRYYCPEFNRFISTDIALGMNCDLLSYNLYLYASNNPIMLSDYSGTGFFSNVGKFLKKAVKATKKVAKKCLDFGVSVVNKIICIEYNQISEQSQKADMFLASAEVGGSTKVTKNIVGNSDSIIKISINNKNNRVSQSSVGVQINALGTSAKVEQGITNAEFSIGHTSRSTLNENSISLGYDLSEFNVYMGVSHEAPYIGSSSTSSFAKFNVNMIVPIVVVGFLVAPEAMPAILPALGSTGVMVTP